MQAVNDNHTEKYQEFTSRLGQFMRGERTIPASMSEEEWRLSKSNAEMRSARRGLRRVLKPMMVSV